MIPKESATVDTGIFPAGGLPEKIGSSHIFYCKSPLICMFNKALTSGPTG